MNVYEDPSGGFMGRDDVRVTVIHERIECNVPIVLVGIGDTAWEASLELPRELIDLPTIETLGVLESIDASVKEFIHLNGGTKGGGIESQPTLILTCSVNLERAYGGALRIAVNFHWPDVWAELSSDARGRMLRAAELTLSDAQLGFQECVA